MHEAALENSTAWPTTSTRLQHKAVVRQHVHPCKQLGLL